MKLIFAVLMLFSAGFVHVQLPPSQEIPLTYNFKNGKQYKFVKFDEPLNSKQIGILENLKWKIVYSHDDTEDGSGYEYLLIKSVPPK